MAQGPVIGTHDGVFHCDEALACYMLKKLPEYENSSIQRTRNPDLLKKCDIVVDVGGVYDPKTLRFDHHQREFTHTLSTIRSDIKNKLIKLSSAGLIYAHFGNKVIQKILEDLNLNENELFLCYKRVYDVFIEEMDGIDNGIPLSDTQQNYRIDTHLSARVRHLNPAWNVSDDQIDYDKLFSKAMQLVGEEFQETVQRTATIWLPGRSLVQQAIENRFNIHSSGKIIELSQRVSWRDHFNEVERDLGLENEIKFVIFYDRKKSWRVQAIPVVPDSFVCRVFLKEDWRGVRDDKLSDLAGIKGCIFCHANGFIGGNETREGAIKMAVKTLQSENLLN